LPTAEFEVPDPNAAPNTKKNGAGLITGFVSKVII
jgi:hypothetical protein